MYWKGYPTSSLVGQNNFHVLLEAVNPFTDMDQEGDTAVATHGPPKYALTHLVTIRSSSLSNIQEYSTQYCAHHLTHVRDVHRYVLMTYSHLASFFGTGTIKLSLHKESTIPTSQTRFEQCNPNL